MKFLGNLARFTFLIIAIISCSPQEKANEKIKLSLFKENGLTIDSLNKAYQAKEITFDRWDATDVTDSTFSICFIDAKKLPPENFDDMINSFESIGKAIKKSLKDPSKYNSYQIVFVETHDDFGIKSQSHRSGTTLRSSDL